MKGRMAGRLKKPTCAVVQASLLSLLSLLFLLSHRLNERPLLDGAEIFQSIRKPSQTGSERNSGAIAHRRKKVSQ